MIQTIGILNIMIRITALLNFSILLTYIIPLVSSLSSVNFNFLIKKAHFTAYPSGIRGKAGLNLLKSN